MNVRDKVAAITGGASGIGLAPCTQIAQEDGCSRHQGSRLPTKTHTAMMPKGRGLRNSQEA
jgi:NAD(P)-dependent dehydrogenase (short-subunit alcohol dehydrogenase family)